MTTFYVNKLTDTSADTLLALGWADALQRILKALQKPTNDIPISNKGGSFEIVLPCTLQLEELQGCEPFPFLELFISAKQDEKQAKKGRVLQDGFHYDEQQAKQKVRIERRKLLPPGLRHPEAYIERQEELKALLGHDGPRSELPNYQAINVFKVADTFNEIVSRWQELSSKQQWQVLGLLFQLFSQQENDVNMAVKTWENFAKEEQLTGKAKAAMVTAVQVINPTTGKGTNAYKAHKLPTPGGLDKFWLLEMLKFKGFMLGAVPYVLKGSKDRKTYVIQPETVALDTLATIMDRFRHICWSSTAIKQDVFASLRLAQVLVKQRWNELKSGQDLEEFDPQPIVSIASGFDVAFYKDMGSAHAVMNVGHINMPTWFPHLHTLDQVEEAELLLQEHIRVIRRIEGYQGKEGNDEIALLRTYRDFLSGHDLDEFWTFTALYGGYVLRQREHEKDGKRWLPLLTRKGLDTLVMGHQNTNHKLSTILENEGFRSVASAIREATVTAQYRHSQKDDRKYDIRYGLGQELLRKARYRDEFMDALSEFVYLYNAETAREEEKIARKQNRSLGKEDYKKNNLRFPVTTNDVELLTKLLDEYPVSLIAKMLLAYGYARQSAIKKEEIQQDHEQNTDDTTELGQED